MITLRINWLGRPPTSNGRRRQHWAMQARVSRAWRDAGTQAAWIAKVPPMHRIAVTCWGEYPDRRGLPDPDGLSPALKAVLDGLVAAGVVQDDSAPFVASVTYLPPVVEPGCQPGLVVVLEPADIPAVAS